MKQSYVPILRAKKGEFSALSHLSRKTATRILPLFDIPKNSEKKSVDEHLDAVVTDITNAWPKKSLFLDMFAWAPNAVSLDGEHVLEYVKGHLEAQGIVVNPVVGYDRWDVAEYQLALGSMELKGGCNFCIRFDREAVEDVADAEYFQDRVQQMLTALSVPASQTYALIDLDDLTHDAVIDLLPRITSALGELHRQGFNNCIVAGASIPASIALAVKQPKTVGFVARREMLLWQSLYEDFPTTIYGDYGVRSPRAFENVIAPDTNGKIRYTIEKRSLIARGHSLRQPPKGAQNYELARKIMKSGHFLGTDFSWGDEQISLCADEVFKGNSTQWIAIDTNHHIEMVVEEILQFRRHQVMADDLLA